MRNHKKGDIARNKRFAEESNSSRESAGLAAAPISFPVSSRSRRALSQLPHFRGR
jgi:hypothetical protein